MLDEFICHFWAVGSILLLLFYFGEKLLANTADPDQMPHYVASDLSLHCLPMTLLWIPGENGLMEAREEARACVVQMMGR